MKKVVSTIMILMLVFAFAACSRGAQWPVGETASRLPKPDTGKIDRVNEYSDSLSIDIKGIDAVAFETYVKKCADAGFTIEASKSSSSYEAFNTEGYSLRLSLYKSSKELRINLSEPIRLSALRWPSGEAGKQIPKPNSDKGKTIYEYDQQFSLYVGDMSEDLFQSYIDACIDAGFNLDYNRGDTFFSAENALGYELNMTYVGFGVISITMYEPKVQSVGSEPEAADPIVKSTEPAAIEPTAAPTSVPTAVPTSAPTAVPTEQPKSNSPSSDVIRDDIKKAIDSYEAFVDEYCSFVEAYDPKNISSLSAYVSLMQKELEMS